MKVSLIYYLFISKINEIVERQNVLIVSYYWGIKKIISFYFFLFNKSTWNLLLNYINKIKYNNFKLKIYNIRADVPLVWGLYFQDGASPSFEGIVWDLHNRIMFYLVVILFGVSWYAFYNMKF